MRYSTDLLRKGIACYVCSVLLIIIVILLRKAPELYEISTFVGIVAITTLFIGILSTVLGIIHLYFEHRWRP